MNLPRSLLGPKAPVGELVEFVRTEMDAHARAHRVSGRSFRVDFLLSYADDVRLSIEIPWTLEHYELHRTEDELMRSVGR